MLISRTLNNGTKACDRKGHGGGVTRASDTEPLGKKNVERKGHVLTVAFIGIKGISLSHPGFIRYLERFAENAPPVLK